MIRIVPPDDYGPLDDVCARAGEFDWVVFASVNAVDAFVNRLLEGPQDVRCLNGVKLCAVGPATAERLAKHGLKVDLTPPEYRADAVLRELSAKTDVKGLRFLLPRADIGRDVLADELRKQGAQVTEVVAYRTVVAEPDREGEPDIYHMLLERRIDVVTLPARRRCATSSACSAPSRPPTCCARPWSPRSGRSPPRRHPSRGSRRR